jgi:hypothetical protein
MSYIDGSDIYHDLDTILLPTINGWESGVGDRLWNAC